MGIGVEVGSPAKGVLGGGGGMLGATVDTIDVAAAFIQGLDLPSRFRRRVGLAKSGQGEEGTCGV